MVDDASYYMKTLEAKVLELKAVSDAEKVILCATIQKCDEEIFC